MIAAVVTLSGALCGASVFLIASILDTRYWRAKHAEERAINERLRATNEDLHRVLAEHEGRTHVWRGAA